MCETGGTWQGAKMIRTLVIISVFLAALTSGQDLTASPDRAGNKVWRDRGGTSGNDLSIYEPVRSGRDYYLLGMRAQPNYNNMDRPLHSFRDDGNKNNVLKRPDGFRFIWDTRGSTYSYDGSVWRPICPRGYVSLGDFFSPREQLSQPPSQLFDKARCVAANLVGECDIGRRMWSNSGTLGRYYLSVWYVNARNGQFNTNFFYARDQHNEKPGVKAYCLRKESVREI